MRYHGYIKKIIEKDPVTGLCMLYIAADGMDMYCHAVLPPVKQDTPLAFDAEEKKYPVSEGKETGYYEVTECELSAYNHAAAVRYLEGAEFPKVGGHEAERLADAMNTDVFACTRSAHEIYLDVKGCGLSEESVGKILRHIAYVKAYDGFLKYTRSIGCQYFVTAAVFKKYGTESMDTVMKNPYTLMYAGAPIGIAEAEAKKYGIEQYDEKRITAVTYYAMKRGTNAGNTALDMKRLLGKVRHIDEKESDAGFRSNPCLIGEELLSSAYYLDETEGTPLMAGFMTYHVYEEEISRAVKALAGSTTALPDTVPVSAIEESLHIHYSDEQRKAFSAIRSTGIKIITGGPGTGKTTLLNGLLNKYEMENPYSDITLCAPTAVAAERMREATGRDASTIHRLLSITPSKEGIEANREIDSGLIVVDESSMVDTALFSCLITAVRPGALVLMIGDPDQLPSVGPGNILKDLINSDTVPVYRLSHVFRQGEGSSITENAYRIINGNADLIQDKSFRILRAKDLGGTLKKADGVIKRSLEAGLKVSTFTATRQRKFLSGEVALNNRISRIVHGDKEPGVRLGEYVFFAGDPVIFRRNDYEKGYTNGQPGKVVIAGRSDNKKYMLIKSGEREIELSGAEIYDVMPGYCMTAHKSQGGECDNALIILTKECPAMLMRQLLYVEVTRAKKGVLIISEGDALEQAIANDRRAERTTGLPALLAA